MPELSGVYDSALIQPVCRFKDNLSVYTTGVWNHYLVEFIEPIPPGPANVVDMVVQAGQTTLAALGTITKRVVTILQLNDSELWQMRWEPIDNVEGVLWEQSGQARYNTRNVQARVDLATKSRDPFLATTQFWVLGMNRDMNLEVRNPLARATPTARFMFWGYRYILTQYDLNALVQGKITASEPRAKVVNLLKQGDRDVVRQYLGATTWITAEGRQS